MRKGLAAAAALAAAMTFAAPAAATVTPAAATLTIPAGGSATTPATVGVPAVAKADVMIAIDTTTSMATTIDQAKASATAIVGAIQAAVPDTQFAVVDFKDAIDGPAEYVLRQPMTATAADVGTAIGAMTAAGGGDQPEAYNVVFHNAYADPATGWRPDARKFVVVIGDAGPHGVDQAVYPDCPPFDSPDPHNLSPTAELAALAASQRTLIMLATPNSGEEVCYGELLAGAFSGSTTAVLGPQIAAQLAGLITGAGAQVSVVDMTVATAPAGADPSWISFAPATAGPVTAPADVPFGVTATVPAGTPAGSYVFDLEGRADGGDVGHLALTVVVPADTTGAGDGTMTIAKTVDHAAVHRGDVVTYTITIHNGTAADVTVRRVVDLLPRKFRFVSGSATGDGRPKVRYSHRQLTWRRRVVVASGDDLVITFSARVRLRSGCGANRAFAKLGDGTIVRTGPTAEVCVTGGDDEDHDGHDHGGDSHGGGDSHDGGGDHGDGNDSGGGDASGGQGRYG